MPFSCSRRGPPKGAPLARRPRGDHGLTPPRQRLVQVSGFQYPKTAYVLLGLQVRPVGDEHFTIRLCSQRPRAAGRAQTASEDPGTSSLHLLVKCVDIAAHRFVLEGRVIVVGVVNSDQIFCHDFSILRWRLHTYVRGVAKSTKRGVFFYCWPSLLAAFGDLLLERP